LCSEKDFIPEKSLSFNYQNSQLLLTAAAALSQNGQIDSGIAEAFNECLMPLIKALKMHFRDPSQ